MVRIAILFLTGILLSACGPTIILPPPHVLIDGNHGHYHCPPGQARKGNC